MWQVVEELIWYTCGMVSVCIQYVKGHDEENVHNCPDAFGNDQADKAADYGRQMHHWLARKFLTDALDRQKRYKVLVTAVQKHMISVVKESMLRNGGLGPTNCRSGVENTKWIKCRRKRRCGGWAWKDVPG